MSNPTRRFNLRTRKSLKNQLECCECKRNYFPLELSEDDENAEQKENICCDCNEKRQTEPEPKRRAIAIKKEQIDSNFDDQCQSNGPTIYKTTHNLNPGNMVQIHSIELIKPLTVTPATVNGTKVSGSINVKEEKLDFTPKEVMKISRTNRALKNKTNTMETTNDQSAVQADHPNMITKTDTEESLRQKFPNVNRFEFEYLLFLQKKCD